MNLKQSAISRMLTALLLFAGVLAACGGGEPTDSGMDMGSEDGGMGDMDMGGGDVETSGEEVVHGDLHISAVWSRPGFRGDNGAVYMMVMNDGDADTLIGAHTDAAAATELHEMTMEGDVMKMQLVSGGLEIPAGGHVELDSGGYHFMLVDLQDDLQPGGHFPLILQFENGGEVTVEVEVVEP